MSPLPHFLFASFLTMGDFLDQSIFIDMNIQPSSTEEDDELATGNNSGHHRKQLQQA